MKTYVYEREKMKAGTSMITRYTPSEYLWWSFLKLIAYICFLWPLELIF